MKVKFETIIRYLTQLSWLAPLLARISVGWVFVESGWGKLHHLAGVVEYFTSLGIPFPTLQAPFVAAVELIGGLLLISGFATRIASLPLIGTMIVAILTAKLPELASVSDLFATSEYLYILLLLWLVVSGAGVVSLDQLIANKKEGK
jgi:putative oxidoreductase